MKRKFVMMPIFDKQWREMGLDDNDLQNLQAELLKNPQKCRELGKKASVKLTSEDKDVLKLFQI